MENPNIEILMFAVEQLEELADEMVFIGGCATGLLITDPAAPLDSSNERCGCHCTGCFTGRLSSVIRKVT